MPIYTIPTNITNSTVGLEGLLIAESQQVPWLMPGILLFIFMIFVGSGYFEQQRRTGKGNLPMWLAIAGMITTTGAFILYLFPGLIPLEVVIISVIVSTVSSAWFLLTSFD